MDLQHQSTSRYILTSLACILVLTALLLVALNSFAPKTQLPFGMKTTSQAYMDGYLAARAQYQNKCPNLQAEQNINHFTGTVQANDGQTLTVLQTSLDTDPNIDGVSNTRTVTVSNQTLIHAMTQKSPEALNKEIQASQKLGAAGSPPQPFTTTDIKLSDIHVGDTVMIESDQSVRLLATIPATVISIVK